MNFVSHNGQIAASSAPLLVAGNRGFKWGDGIFETMRMRTSSIPLWDLHFRRLSHGLSFLQMFTPPDFEESLRTAVENLNHKNGLPPASRVRLALFRQEDNGAGFVMEQSLLDDNSYTWNEKGWKLSLCEAVQKSADALSMLKSANYLPYLVARRHAEAMGSDEAFILNSSGHLVDGSRTNIFLVKNGGIVTPPLSSGPVDGVMRRYLISRLPEQADQERALRVRDLEEADEIFLTNAVEGVRWVEHFGARTYGNTISRSVFELLAALQPPTKGSD